VQKGKDEKRKKRGKEIVSLRDLAPRKDVALCPKKGRGVGVMECWGY
jgi:hypothetical protein